MLARGLNVLVVAACSLVLGLCLPLRGQDLEPPPERPRPDTIGVRVLVPGEIHELPDELWPRRPVRETGEPTDVPLTFRPDARHALSLSTKERVPVAADEIATLARIPGLEVLSANWFELDLDGIRAIARLDSLKSLSLSGPIITTAAMHELRALRTLERLHLYFHRSQPIEPAAIRELAALPHLRYLQLAQWSIALDGDAGAALATLSQVKELNVGLLEAGAAAGIARMASLQSIRTESARPEVLQALATSKTLRHIRCPAHALTPSVCDALLEMPALQDLSISVAEHADLDAAVQELPVWRVVARTVTPGQLRKIAGITALRELSIFRVTDSDLSQLAPLAETLQSLQVETEEELPSLSALTGLRELRIRRHGGVTGRATAVAVGKLSQLQTLELAGLPLADDDLAQLAKLRQLTSLTIEGASFDGQSLVWLAALPLQHISLKTSQRFDANGCAALGQIRTLREVDLEFGCTIQHGHPPLTANRLPWLHKGDGWGGRQSAMFRGATDAALSDMIRNLPDLLRLDVGGHPRLTDACLDALLSRRWQRLNLAMTGITRQAAEKLQAANPRGFIRW